MGTVSKALNLSEVDHLVHMRHPQLMILIVSGKKSWSEF